MRYFHNVLNDLAIYFQLAEKIQKAKGPTTSTSTTTKPTSSSCRVVGAIEAMPSMAEEDSDAGDDIPQDTVEDAGEEGAFAMDATEELPNIPVARRKDRAATKAAPVTTATAPTVITPLDQNLIQFLASRAVDSEQLKKRLDSVLAESRDPQMAEKLHYGQWMASCIAQVPDDRWAEFIAQSVALLGEFVPNHHLPPAPSCVRPTVSQTPVSAPTVSLGPVSVPTMSQEQMPFGSFRQPQTASVGGYGATGHSYGHGSQTAHTYPGAYGQSYTPQPQAGSSGYGGQSGPSTAYTTLQPMLSTPVVSSQGNTSVTDASPITQFASMLSTPLVPSLDSSSGLLPAFSPSTLMNDPSTLLNVPLNPLNPLKRPVVNPDNDGTGTS